MRREQAPVQKAATNMKDLTGRVSGKLTVIERSGKTHCGIIWKCQCSCGNIAFYVSTRINRNKVTSCGRGSCRYIRRDDSLRNEPLYTVWREMIRRCTNPNAFYYHLYGGRGINVCAEWRESLNVFKKWAIENGYPKGLSIDRRNNNLGYSPDNCRWATAEVQMNNTRSNIFLEFNGRRLTISQWARETGLTKSALLNRFRSGWSISDCLTIPLSKGYPRVKRK